MAEPSQVVTLGETMGLIASGSVGRLTHGATATVRIAGAESNVAIGLARLGVPVTWVGRTGGDSLGDLIVRELRAEGVDVASVRDEGAQTGLILKEQRTRELTRIWYYRAGSAGSRLLPEDVPEAAIGEARLLHVTGITPALSDSAAAAVSTAVAIARDAGVLVSFDVNYRSRLWSREDAVAGLGDLVRGCDVLFAGSEEAALFCTDGEGSAEGAADPMSWARELSALGPSQVIVTLGADGCVGVIDGAEHRCEAVPVSVVDAVGAGDAFVAGYLAGLLEEIPVEARLRQAATLGAVACTTDGDWEGLPTASELAAFGSAEQVER